MLPNRPQSFFQQYRRQIRLNVSLVTMSIGAWLGVNPQGDSDLEKMASSFGGAILIGVGWCLHPGSVGDAHVPERDQRGLVNGMVRDIIKTPSDRHWAMARVGSMAVMAAIQAAIAKDPKLMINWAASGGTMTGYVTDRAWGDFRMHRAHPLDGKTGDALAWFINYAIGNMLDTSGAMMGASMNLGLRTAILGGQNVSPPSFGDLTGALVPMYMGSLASQAFTGAVSYTRYSESAAARVPAHISRLVARAYGRMLMSGGSVQDQILPFVSDGIAAFTMHRWPKSTSKAFMSGIRLSDEKAAVLNPLVPNFPEVNFGDISVLNFSILPLPIAATRVEEIQPPALSAAGAMPPAAPLQTTIVKVGGIKPDTKPGPPRTRPGPHFIVQQTGGLSNGSKAPIELKNSSGGKGKI